MKESLILSFVCFLLLSCVSTGGGKKGDSVLSDTKTEAEAGTVASATSSSSASSVAESSEILLPQVPAVIQEPQLQVDYLADHFWVDIPLADTAFLASARFEQYLANFVFVAERASKKNREQAISKAINSAARGGTDSFLKLGDLFEKYLDDPNSPLRNEPLYRDVLLAITGSEDVDSLLKLRYLHQLERVNKNPIGSVATDIRLTLGDGARSALSAVNAPFTILYFNNPDCEDCKRVKEILISQSPLLEQAGAKVFSVYPDKDIALWQAESYPTSWISGYSPQVGEDGSYDLRAIPNLYLLDEKKRVVLKDAPVEQVLYVLGMQSVKKN